MLKIVKSRENIAGPLMKVCIPLRENFLAPVATIAPASVIDDPIQRKMRGWEVARAEKGITWVIFNDYMDVIIRVIKWLETSAVSVDRVSEVIKHEMKRQ